jgi:hypothetical protein
LDLKTLTMTPPAELVLPDGDGDDEEETSII